MSNYKDVDKIINELTEIKIPVYDKAFSIRDLIGVLEKAPTADVQEVRHAKRIEISHGQRRSNCLHRIYNTTRYCPSCGAKIAKKWVVW